MTARRKPRAAQAPAVSESFVFAPPLAEAPPRVSPPLFGDEAAATSASGAALLLQTIEEASNPAHTGQTADAADRVTIGSAADPLIRWNAVELVAERPWGDKPPKGSEWRVLAFFPEYAKQFAGIGPTIWAALAEMIEDWSRRGVRGLPHSPARNA